jgi:hypothetical protein
MPTPATRRHPGRRPAQPLTPERRLLRERIAKAVENRDRNIEDVFTENELIEMSGLDPDYARVLLVLGAADEGLVHITGVGTRARSVALPHLLLVDELGRIGQVAKMTDDEAHKHLSHFESYVRSLWRGALLGVMGTVSLVFKDENDKTLVTHELQFLRRALERWRVWQAAHPDDFDE